MVKTWPGAISISANHSLSPPPVPAASWPSYFIFSQPLSFLTSCKLSPMGRTLGFCGWGLSKLDSWPQLGQP